jgi:ribonuclease HI
MELTAACVALETIEEGYVVVSIYSDSSYLVNCMRRGGMRRGGRTAGSITATSR